MSAGSCNTDDEAKQYTMTSPRYIFAQHSSTKRLDTLGGRRMSAAKIKEVYEHAEDIGREGI